MNIKLYIKIIYFFIKKYFMYIFLCYMEKIIMLVLQLFRIINLFYNVDVFEDQMDEFFFYVINVIDDFLLDMVMCDVVFVIFVIDIFFIKIV